MDTKSNQPNLQMSHWQKLQKPSFLQRHSWAQWLPVLIGLFIGMFVGSEFIGNINTNINPNDIKPSQAPRVSPTDAAMKTYTDDRYSFSAKYPNTFSLEKIGEIALFRDGADLLIESHVSLLKNRKPLQSILTLQWLIDNNDTSLIAKHSDTEKTVTEKRIHNTNYLIVLNHDLSQSSLDYAIFIPSNNDVLLFNISGRYHRANKATFESFIDTFITTFEPISTSTPIPTSFITSTPSPTGVISEPVVCTQEALLCPDGSYVGRQGPKCEFAPCKPMP